MHIVGEFFCNGDHWFLLPALCVVSWNNPVYRGFMVRLHLLNAMVGIGFAVTK